MGTDDLSAVVADGPLVTAAAVSALAGLASILSPCILPLVSAYLSYVSGLTGAELSSGRRRGRVLAGTSLFMSGFAAVFIAMSVLAAQVALFFRDNTGTIQRVAGVLIVVLGLALLDVLPGVRQHRGLRHVPSAGLVGAPLFGAAFALSWTPCVGPALGTVLALAAAGGSTGRAVLLATAYCAGFGLPFLGLGLGLRRLLGTATWVRAHGIWVTRFGGAMFVVVGLALASGLWVGFTRWLLTTVGVGDVPL